MRSRLTRLVRRRRPAKGCIDRVGHLPAGFTLIDGWSSDEPLFYYKSRPVAAAITRMKRPDLISHFGPGSEDWGFRARLLTVDQTLDDAQVFVRFGKRGALTQVPSPEKDKPLDRMFERFINLVTPGATILEIGSRARSGISRRHLFRSDCRYIGFDIAVGPNVDVVGDAHDLRAAIRDQVDFLFAMSTFEHLLMPWKVALEMSAVMRIGAVGYILSHQTHPLHEEPWDFWRFSAQAWRGLFNAHTGFEVLEAAYQYPASITPLVDAGEPGRTVEIGPAWLLSGCLIKKTGQALVEWNAHTRDVYDLQYSHGT